MLRQPMSLPRQLVFVRHGHSLANQTRTMSHRHADWGLSPQGEAEVAALGAWYRGRPVALVVHSPLERARQTAAAVANVSGAPVTVQEGLRELNVGEWDGRTDAWGEHDLVLRRWEVGHTADRFPGGESWDEAAARFLGALEAAVAARDPDRPGDVVVVGHTGIFCAVLRRVTRVPGEPVGRLVVPNTSLTTLEQDGAGGWTVVRWAETPHLPGSTG